MSQLSKAPAVRREIVGEESAAQRVDNYLLRVCRGVPKSHIYRIVRSGEVRVNGRRVAASYRLQAGDELRIPPLRVAADTAPRIEAIPPGQPFRVVWEDEALLVLDKPAGTAVHGGSGISFGVIEQLRRQRPDARFLELVHRLDRETSGLLMVAKRRPALTALHEALRRGEVDKHYRVLVKGRWMEPLRHVRLPLHKYLTPDGERRVSVRADGKAAHSIVRLVARWENFSLLDVELRTGRTHQIRVHMAHLGYPICGDDKYGDFTLNRMLHTIGLKRMFLHAAQMSLAHPLSGAPLSLAAPLPEELTACLRAIAEHERQDDGPTL